MYSNSVKSEWWCEVRTTRPQCFCVLRHLIMFLNLQSQGLLPFCAGWVGWLCLAMRWLLSLLFIIWCKVKCLSWQEACYCCGAFSQNWFPKDSKGDALWEGAPPLAPLERGRSHQPRWLWASVFQQFRIEDNQRCLFMMVLIEKSLLERGSIHSTHTHTQSKH